MESTHEFSEDFGSYYLITKTTVSSEEPKVPLFKTLVIYLNAHSMDITYLICDLPLFEERDIKLQAGNEHPIAKELYDGENLKSHIHTYKNITDFKYLINLIEEELKVTIC